MDKTLLTQLVEDSTSLASVARKLYNNDNCGNRDTIKKYIKLYKLDTSHFTNKQTHNLNNLKSRRTLKEILVIDSIFDTTNLKNRLYKEGLKTPVCELCGQTELWRGEKMSLILDHINGVTSDLRIENLQIVCPNCNATLTTFSGKKNKK